MVIMSSASGQMSIEDDAGTDLALRLVGLFAYALFMGTIEVLTKGKSLSKLITGTRAVNLDDSPIKASKAFARAFSRAVTFCVFWALGAPCASWQERWTDTMVIKEPRK